MNIKWYGTASIELSCNGQRIIFDPFVPLKGSKVPVSITDFDGYEAIFITHGHFDHIMSLPEIVSRNPNVRIYCSKTPFATLQKKGVPQENLKMIAPDDTIKLDNFTVRTFHGKHAILPKASLKRVAGIIFSRHVRNLPKILKEHKACRENDETIFYLIEAAGQTISIMGSLNLRDDVSYPANSDHLILPYNGWEDNYPPAVKVIERLSPKSIWLDHYDDTFPPLTGYIDIEPIKNKYPGRCKELQLYKTIRKR